MYWSLYIDCNFALPDKPVLWLLYQRPLALYASIVDEDVDLGMVLDKPLAEHLTT